MARSKKYQLPKIVIKKAKNTFGNWGLASAHILPVLARIIGKTIIHEERTRKRKQHEAENKIDLGEQEI